ncbi:hypothetical protein JZ751_006201 [Albula glossodonta]|uniref:Uncharacterized protein n=1 Tax=Albula glossodonta TaxID=121402 RepID=A0A8T2NB33_9TELE|nr:hypothetical protein JZ751_006201 [Albula glossodonta]
MDGGSLILWTLEPYCTRVPRAEALLLGHPVPAPLLRPAEQLGTPPREQAVRAGVIQEELDGGLHVLHEVGRLSLRGRGQILQNKGEQVPHSQTVTPPWENRYPILKQSHHHGRTGTPFSNSLTTMGEQAPHSQTVSPPWENRYPILKQSHHHGRTAAGKSEKTQQTWPPVKVRAERSSSAGPRVGREAGNTSPTSPYRPSLAWLLREVTAFTS